MHNNKAFTLINGGKAFFFFYYHQRFLPNYHKFRNKWKDFLKTKVEKDVAPPILLGKELYDEAS
jgi:hypothetical protein